MIATSRRSASTPAISRQYEFSRLEDQRLASAYEALVPVASRRLAGLHPERPESQTARTRERFPQPSAMGA